MQPFSLRSPAFAALLAGGLGGLPTAAQDILQDAVTATGSAAQTTANVATATQSVGQAVTNAQQNPLAAPSTATVASQLTAAASVTPPAGAVISPTTNCSPATTPQMFRLCLALTAHHNGSWKAAHPLVPQVKSDGLAAGIGGTARNIPAPLHTQN